MKVYQLSPLTGEILHMKEFLRLIIISIPFIKKKHNKYGINITQRLNKKFKPNTQPPCQVSSVFRLWERKKKKKFLFVQLAKRSDTKLEAEAANQMR